MTSREALFSTIHEAGHAIYEQGIRQEFEATPLASGTSSGVHESQSRLWENVVGRGRPFWQHFYPKLQAAFPAQLGQVPQDTFYRAINKVGRSLIRTDADEVTYNLHVIIRFGLELDLLEGKLAVRDLAEAWRARYQSDLGISSPDDKDGVLQDVHWYGGFIGGSFQGYTLGNIMGAQFYAAALRARPSIPAEIAQGPVRHAAPVAGGQHLPARPQVHRRRDHPARHRRPLEHRPLHCLPQGQVRGVVPPVGHGRASPGCIGDRRPKGEIAVDVYEALQEKLNQHAMGAPKREEFLEILRILFTPEEAELAAHLPFAPQRVDEIAQALGRPEAEVLRLCEQMADKTLLYSYDMRGTKLYMLFPSAPGLFEFPIMKNAVSPGSIPNVDFGRLGKLWWRYHDDGWGLEMGGSVTPAARVIPVQQAITPDLHVYAYEEVATFVNNASTWPSPSAPAGCRSTSAMPPPTCAWPSAMAPSSWPSAAPPAW